MVTDCSGSDHHASARVVLVTTPQGSNPAPPVSGRSVGSFSHAEPGEARDDYQSAQHHNAQRFRSRREGGGTGSDAKPAHREERPVFQGKRFFPRNKVTGPPAFLEFPVVLQNIQGQVSFPKLEEDGAPVGRVRPGAERKADPKRPIFNRLSQRGPAGQVVTVPESSRGCGHSVPHPGTHR